MFHVKHCYNKEQIKSLLEETELKDGFLGSGCIDSYMEDYGDQHTCYLMRYNNEIAGMAIVMNLSKGLPVKNKYIVDVGFFKKYRGKVALKLCEIAFLMFYTNFECDQLLAIIKKTNKAAYFNARRLNFKVSRLDEINYYLEHEKNGW